MKLNSLALAVCGAALGLMLAGCGGGGNSSSSSITLAQASDPVSYTHLTLPTICRV